MALILPAHRRQRGAAAVELALVLPLLLLLLGGIVDFGRFFFAQVQFANASREGVRALVLKAPLADATQRARDSIPGIATQNFYVDPAKVVTCASSSFAQFQVSDPNFTWLSLSPAMRMVGSDITKKPASIARMKCGG